MRHAANVDLHLTSSPRHDLSDTRRLSSVSKWVQANPGPACEAIRRPGCRLPRRRCWLHCSQCSQPQPAACSDVARTAQPLQPALQPGDTVQLTCTKLAAGGQGVCRLPTGMVVLCWDALPGEELLACIDAVRADFAVATKTQTLQPCPGAAAPRCRHFDTCGGCSLQGLQHAAQLAAKQEIVADCLTRTAKLGPDQVQAVLQPILPSSEEYGFRNKMTFAFSISKEGLELGLHSRRSKEITPVEHCELQGPAANAIVRAVAAAAQQTWLPARNAMHHGGSLTSLTVRSNWLGEFLVDICTSPQVPTAALHPLSEAAVAAAPNNMVSVSHTLAPRKPAAGSSSSRSRRAGRLDAQAKPTVRMLHGSHGMRERLGGLTFHLAGSSFFQTNTKQAEVLLGAVSRLAGLQPTDVLLDLFCGVGAFGLALAGQCRRVLGWELSGEAVTLAEQNAACMGISNAAFAAADLTRPGLLGDRLGSSRPDVVIADPPRAGLPTAVRDWLCQHQPKRLVYCSCDAVTMARDLRLLLAEPGGYRLHVVQPVDMFPQTSHIECVCLLEQPP